LPDPYLDDASWWNSALTQPVANDREGSNASVALSCTPDRPMLSITHAPRCARTEVTCAAAPRLTAVSRYDQLAH
jgi:hypothetical protein